MTNLPQECDYLIIGGGILGLCCAHHLRTLYPEARIVLIEKEPALASHASGRNSGVLHAGFYYSADSLKAKFTKEGNAAWTLYCQEHNLPINRCGKIIIATQEEEEPGLAELKRRGDINGISLDWIDPAQARELEPLARVRNRALWSPTTSSVNPLQVCAHLELSLINKSVYIGKGVRYISLLNQKEKFSTVHTSAGKISAALVINCAGLYADKIAQNFGYGKDYTLLPFKGIYLKTPQVYTGLRRHLYPVPNLKNPFLGVHFTLTVEGKVKIGPTAIPGFWREHYEGLDRFDWRELLEILKLQSHLFLFNKWGFRSLALEEFKKYKQSHLLNLARKMVHELEVSRFTEKAPPGIRAQLLQKSTGKLVQDFVIEGDTRSLHILNAVSPAFTCALPFTHWALTSQMNQKSPETN